MTKGRQPILMISASAGDVSGSVSSRSLERSYPRSANSKKRVKVSYDLSVGQKRVGG